jgi:site-specific recombinase XerD
MKERIEKYMKEETLREVYSAIKNITSQRHDLDEFALFMEKRKGARRKCDLSDITEEDGRAYYRYLEKGRRKGPGIVERKIERVNSFLDFSVKRGWIVRRPWGDNFTQE